MLARLLDRLTTPALPVPPLPARLLPMLLVAYACLLPRELSLVIEGATLQPYRLALIVVTPFALAFLARQPTRPSIMDFFALFASAWFVVALYMASSLSVALVTGTSYALDFGLAYLVGRAAVRQPGDLRLLFTWLLPGLIALLLLLMAESLSHRMLLRPFLADLLNLPDPYIYFRLRFGLLRAMGPFPHPILAGVFLAGALPLAWYLAHNHWQRALGLLAAAGAIFSVSAAAILGLLIGVGMIAAETLQRLTRLPIFLFAGAYLALALAAIKAGSESGVISFLIRYLTLDQGSGYYRLWIWEFGGAEALAHPWFGLGQRDWARPIGMESNSVDAYWLALAMFYGFPAVAGALGVMGGTVVALARTQRLRAPADRQVAFAIIAFITIAALSGLTVHLWEGLHAWIILLCGAGVSIVASARQAAAQAHLAHPHARFGPAHPPAFARV